MLTGKGAMPAFWSRLLKSFTAGIPFAKGAPVGVATAPASSTGPRRRPCGLAVEVDPEVYSRFRAGGSLDIRPEDESPATDSDSADRT